MKTLKTLGAVTLAFALATGLAGCKADDATPKVDQDVQTQTITKDFGKAGTTLEADDDTGGICIGICMGPHIDLGSGELKIGPSFGGIGFEF